MSLSKADVVAHNAASMKTLSSQKFNTSKDKTTLNNKNRRESAVTVEKIIGHDNKPINNQYLKQLHQKHPNLRLLKSSESQNEWEYVRKDFDICTQHFNANKQDGINQPPLTNITDQILTVRGQTISISDDAILNQLMSEHNDLLSINADLKGKHNDAYLLLRAGIQKVDLEYGTSTFDGEDTNWDENQLRTFREKKMNERHDTFVQDTNKKIEELQKQIQEKMNGMTAKQKKVMHDYASKYQPEGIKTPAYSTANDKVTSTILNTLAPDAMQDMKEHMENDADEIKLIRKQLVAAKEELRRQTVQSNTLNDSIEKLQAQVETGKEEEKKLKNLQKEMALQQIKVKQMKTMCLYFKTQVESIQVAVEHERTMKELSTLNPVSMLDFYAKRLTGAEDSSSSVIKSIRAADAKQLKKFETERAKMGKGKITDGEVLDLNVVSEQSKK